jgi:hypothetical protein
MVVIIFYIIFLSMVIQISPSFSHMEEGSEEIESMMEQTGGGDTTHSIVNRDMIPEVQMILILSLIIFGLLDGLFAFMLWNSKPPFQNEKILKPLFAVQLSNRFIGGYAIVMMSVAAVFIDDPRDILNTLYLLIIASACATMIIMVIIKKKVFEGRKATKILVSRNEAA